MTGAPAMDDRLRRAVVANLAAFEVRRHPVEGRKHAAVAVAIVADEHGAPSVIITKRTPRLTAHAGQWALPGGRIDPGETVEQAALRELHEEVGLRLDAADVLGRLDDYPTRSGYVITPVVVWAGGTVELTPNDAEVHIIHRVSFAELDRPGSPEFVRIPESDRPVVRLLIYEHKIHAPTAAVVYQFREVAVKGNATRVDHLEQPVFAWR
ncbi:NUDIX hydrolase [Desertibaculum subflavum]|uniref:NUDIX hydrolase n=1 Tax=Desertibaculum subflavum TaxID=2268458 RepID=UPI000E65F7FC